MSLKERIHADLVTALKAKDSETASVLRMMKAEILNKEKEGTRGTEVSEDEIQAILQSMVKRRRDSIDQFRKADRSELADKEEAEISVIEVYLPPAVSEEEVRAAVAQVIEEVGASSPKDLGRVMGKAMGALKKTGKVVDGNKVREAASELLGPS